MSTPCSATEPEVLKRVTGRLLHADERPQFDRRLETQYSLASARLAGQTLRYVAALDGQWVALLTFSAAAFHLKLRERWLRWTPCQCARRLHCVVNNSRFLVRPERARYPNLASRVLGLCLRRLAADWQAHWGHPVLVVESFVEESRYRAPLSAGKRPLHHAGVGRRLSLRPQRQPKWRPGTRRTPPGSGGFSP